MYDLANYYGYDDNRTVETAERRVLEILKNVFNSDLETAQNLINETSDAFYNSYGKKEQAICDRNLFI